MTSPKQALKSTLFRVAAQLPASVWDHLCAEACLIPYYHMVSDEPVPHVSHLYRFRSTKEFKADLDLLLGCRRAVTLDEFVSSVRSTGEPPRSSCLLTFDDGFREMHDVVMPILIAKGVPAVFFVNSASLDNREMGHHQKISLLLAQRENMGSRFPDVEVLRQLANIGIAASTVESSLKSIPWRSRTILDGLGPLCGVDFIDYAHRHQPYLTSTQTRALQQNGLDIGAHSVDHPLYADLSLDEQLHQTRQSMEFLVNSFGLKRRAFAFPHSDRGVPTAFFDTIFGDGTIEVSFGTSGPARDFIPWSFQRFSMENEELSTRTLLARYALRNLKRRIAGGSTIQRN